jgi:hypothetical protein
MGAADSDPPIGGLELSVFFLQEDLLLNKKNSHRSGSTGFISFGTPIAIGGLIVIRYKNGFQ